MSTCPKHPGVEYGANANHDAFCPKCLAEAMTKHCEDRKNSGQPGVTMYMGLEDGQRVPIFLTDIKQVSQ